MNEPLQEGHSEWRLGLHARREALSPSTWWQYRARARRELLRLAGGPWTDEDCVRMARRIERDVDLWVLFLWESSGEVEPTNNRAERELRPAVIDRRRMQQNRSLRGIYRDVVLRSVAMTCEHHPVSFEVVVSEALLARTRDGPGAIPPTLRRAVEGSSRKGEVQPAASAAHAAAEG